MTKDEYCLDKTRDSTARWVARPYQLVGLFDMLRFSAAHFVQIASTLTSIEEITFVLSADNANTLLAQSTKDRLIERLPNSQELCEEIGLKMSALHIQQTLASLDRFTYAQLGLRSSEIRDRIRDELSLCLLLHVSSENREAYENADPFGPKVTANFSNAAYDVEEASKCLALDR